MAKQIIFTWEDKEYTLEYTRRTVKQMEDEGFVARDIDSKPMPCSPGRSRPTTALSSRRSLTVSTPLCRTRRT